MRLVFALLLALAAPVPAVDKSPPAEGFVKMRIMISPEGNVTDAKVLESDMPAEYHDKALVTIKKWKFKPKMKNGKPVAATGIQVLTFKKGE